MSTEIKTDEDIEKLAAMARQQRERDCLEKINSVLKEHRCKIQTIIIFVDAVPTHTGWQVISQ